MHPDTQQLAAYLDNALPDDQRVNLRAHVLTCPVCATRLQQLRVDAARISATFDAMPAPDVRAAVRARLPHRSWWFDRRWALGLVVLVALVVVSLSPLVTVGQRNAVLAVSDNRHGQLLALDSATGATLATVAVGERPTLVRYDSTRGRLYVLTADGVVTVAPRAWEIVAQWRATTPALPGGGNGLVVDEEAGLLYVAQPASGEIVVLDADTLEEKDRIDDIPHPGSLALLPDGRTLAALDDQTGALWTVALPGGQPQPWQLGPGDQARRGWIAAAPDAQAVYVLHGLATSGAPPELWRAHLRTGQIDGPFRLEASPPPQDLVLLDQSTLAVARGDGVRGGIELFATMDLHSVAHIDPQTDAHVLVPAGDGGLFVLNWSHDTVIRYNGDGTRQWLADLIDAQPRGGAVVR